MARGVRFDTYQPQAPKPAGPGAKAKFAGDSRTAPGPEPRLCEECGRPAMFGEGVNLLRGVEGNWFCRNHCASEFRRMKP